MRDRARSDEEGNPQPITDDIYWQVMPPERHGRVRGMGPGVTPSNFFGPQASSSRGIASRRVEELEKELADMKRQAQEKEEEMERRLHEQKQDMDKLLEEQKLEQKQEMEKRMLEYELERKQEMDEMLREQVQVIESRVMLQVQAMFSQNRSPSTMQ